MSASQPPDATPRVSIALTTYQGARFLPAQLESFRRQTLAPDELVVGDDGSRDDTLRILEEFAATTSFPVRVTRNPRRLGFAENFLATLSRTAGDIVAFSDQDDVWRDHKLERCVGVLRANADVAVLHHRTRVIDAGGVPLGYSFPHRGPTRRVPPLGLDPWTPAYGLTMVVRRPVLDLAIRQERPPSFDLDGSLMDHDEWIAFLGRALFDVAIVDEDLVDYRSHAANVIGPPPDGRIGRILSRLRFGADDYRRHAGLYRAFRRFWESLIGDPAIDVARREAAVARFAMLEAAATRAAAARDSRGRPRRMLALAELAMTGVYRPRRRGGLGADAFARDILATAIDADGEELDALAVSESVIERIVLERELGSSFDRIANGLEADRIPAPSRSGWRGSSVHRVLYLHHGLEERELARDEDDPRRIG